ncbi:DUF3524 domain-containing protein [Myxococcota bacterium]|nr:DUF3524 domain-containing protein [Myxococcota bacterium]
MDICFLEPFFSGSHETWLTQLAEHSAHNITILSQRGRFWKWRMYGSALTLTEAFSRLDKVPDLIVASDMLDLSSFLALNRRTIPAHVPVGIYFHENQVAYPWQSESEDVQKGRDIHYAFINYASALAADFLFFNSLWNRDSFFFGMEELLRKMPDDRHRGTVDLLKGKSHIMPIGMDLKSLDRDEPRDAAPEPLIIWNHRLEHDKNPLELLEVLLELASQEVPFHLALLTEITPLTEPRVMELIGELKERVTITGMISRAEYASWLHRGQILPVTSRHDFFGISIMEAVYCGCYPLLPRRLTYPALYEQEKHPEIFYDSRAALKSKLKQLLESPPPPGQYSHLAAPYDWSSLARKCDALLSAMAVQKA